MMDTSTSMLFGRRFDADVAELRRVLDDPLRVAVVSAQVFPLRVWENLFAADRERRAAGGDASDDRSSDLSVPSQRALTGAAGGASPSSQALDATTNRSVESADRDRSPHSLDVSPYSGGAGGGASRTLRVCRGPGMSATAMRRMARECLSESVAAAAGLESERDEGELAKTTTTTAADSAPPRASDWGAIARTLGSGGGGGHAATTTTTPASSRAAAVPVAVLECVSVPERAPSAQASLPRQAPQQQQQQPHVQKASAKQLSVAAVPMRRDTGADGHYQTLGRNQFFASVAAARARAFAALPRPRGAAAASVLGPGADKPGRASQRPRRAALGENAGGAGGGADGADAGADGASADGSESPGAHSIGSFRSQPVRPFAPVASIWHDRTSDWRAAPRAAVDRHDLPFEVTPANDFRQLPCPLVGLGHAVPYKELAEEQRTMMARCDRLWAAEVDKRDGGH
jgi:hypothetical protein